MIPLTVAVLLALTLLASLAGSAAAAYNVTGFTVTPSVTQAAGHPKLTQTITSDAVVADSTGGDDLRTVSLAYPAGLMLKPAAATTRCSSTQLSADGCPSGSYVGSLTAKWRYGSTTVSATGSVYVLTAPTDSSLATLGMVVRASGWSKFNLKVSAHLRTGTSGDHGITLATTQDLPRKLAKSGVSRSITISQFAVTLNARANSSQTGAYFMTNPTRCDAATTTATFVTYGGATATRTSSFNPTGCSSVPFNPTVSVAPIAPAAAATGLTASLSLPVADASVQSSHVKNVTVDLPPGSRVNTAALNALPALCTVVQLDTDSCPSGSSIGTAGAASPLLASALSGEVYLVSRSAQSVVGTVLRGPNGFKTALLGMVGDVGDFSTGTDHARISFSSLPQLPLASANLNITAPAFTSFCPRVGPITVTLNGWSGAAATRNGSSYVVSCPSPTDTTITSGPPSPTMDPTPTFQFTSSNVDSTFECRVDDGAYAACTSPHTTAPLVYGMHMFCVRAIASGLADPTPACATFEVSGETPWPPTPSCSVSGSTITCTWSAVSAGMTASCRLDGGATSLCTSPYVRTGVSTGAHTITICFTDQYGNISCSTHSVTVAGSGFAPSFDQTFGSPTAGAATTATWDFSLPAGNEPAKTLRILETPLLKPNYPAFGQFVDMCPSSSASSATSVFDPAVCPVQAKVGTMTLSSPAYGGTITGDVFLIAKSPVPWLGVTFGVTLKLTISTSLPQVDPSCDPLNDPNGVCQTQLLYTINNLPNVDNADATVTLAGPTRVGTGSTSLPGELFVFDWPPCSSPVTTRGSFTSWGGTSATVTDSDPIAGCSGSPGDVTPPVVIITAPVNGSSTTASSVTLNYVATDDSGAAPTCSPSTGTGIGLSIGVNTITVTCTDASGNIGTASVTVTRTSGAGTFAPTFDQTFSNPTAGGLTGLTWTFSVPAGNDAAKTLVIDEPPAQGPNWPSFGATADRCPLISHQTYAFDPTGCPAQAKIGSMTITSPAYGGTISGDVYVVNDTPFPGFGVDFGPTLRLFVQLGMVQVDPNCDPNVDLCQTRLRYVLGSLPNVDALSATLTLGGPDRTGANGSTLPGAPFSLSYPPCPAPADTTSARGIAWTGLSATVTDINPIAGC